MSLPTDRRYLASHEWHQRDGDIVTIGITSDAANELTDVTYVKLPAVGAILKANAPMGEIESVKATSDLFSGVSGSVVAVNAELATTPGLVNADAFGAGWMVKVKMTNPGEFDALLSADDYSKEISH